MADEEDMETTVAVRPLEDCTLLPALSDALWRERASLEHLLYRLVSARLLLAADERRHVPQALAEVEAASDAIWAAERDRQAAVRMVANDWGVAPDELTLEVLAVQSPEPWDALLAEHHQAFGALAAEIDATARDNTRLASAGLNAIRDSLGELTAPRLATYGATGRMDHGTAGATSVDRIM